jgi:hypothetical protein
MDDELLTRPTPLVGVVLAGEHERLHDAAAVDVLGDLVGVLGDDRKQVREQLALDRREVRRDVDRQRAGRVLGTVDRPVAGDGDGLVLCGTQAACGIVSLVRYRSPSSSLRW